MTILSVLKDAGRTAVLGFLLHPFVMVHRKLKTESRTLTCFAEILDQISLVHGHAHGAYTNNNHPETLYQHILDCLDHAIKNKYSDIEVLTVILHDIGKMSSFKCTDITEIVLPEITDPAIQTRIDQIMRMRISNDAKIHLIKKETGVDTTMRVIGRYLSFPGHGEQSSAMIIAAYNDGFLQFVTKQQYFEMADAIRLHMCGYRQPAPCKHWVKLRACMNPHLLTQLRNADAAKSELNPDFEEFISKPRELVRNPVICLAGGSAAGKTTVANALAERYPNIVHVERDRCKQIVWARHNKHAPLPTPDVIEEFCKKGRSYEVNQEMRRLINRAYLAGKIVVIDTLLCNGVDIASFIPPCATMITIHCDRNILLGESYKRHNMSPEVQLSIAGECDSLTRIAPGTQTCISAYSVNSPKCANPDFVFTVALTESGLVGMETVFHVLDGAYVDYDDHMPIEEFLNRTSFEYLIAHNFTIKEFPNGYCLITYMDSSDHTEYAPFRKLRSIIVRHSETGFKIVRTTMPRGMEAKNKSENCRDYGDELNDVIYRINNGQIPDGTMISVKADGSLISLIKFSRGCPEEEYYLRHMDPWSREIYNACDGLPFFIIISTRGTMQISKPMACYIITALMDIREPHSDILALYQTHAPAIVDKFKNLEIGYTYLFEALCAGNTTCSGVFHSELACRSPRNLFLFIGRSDLNGNYTPCIELDGFESAAWWSGDMLPMLYDGLNKYISGELTIDQFFDMYPPLGGSCHHLDPEGFMLYFENFIIKYKTDMYYENHSKIIKVTTPNRLFPRSIAVDNVCRDIDANLRRMNRQFMEMVEAEKSNLVGLLDTAALTAYTNKTGVDQLKMLLNTSHTRSRVDEISTAVIRSVYPTCGHLKIFGVLKPWLGDEILTQEIEKFQTEISTNVFTKNRSIPFQILSTCIAMDDM